MLQIDHKIIIFFSFFSSSSLTPSEFAQMLEKVEKRLAEQLSTCRDNMMNVPEEMQKLMKTLKDRKTIADALLRHLEGKYYNKKWFVVVHDGVQSYNLSEGFYTASVDGGTFAAAISVDRVDAQGFSPLADKRLNEFKFPIKMANQKLISIEEADEIHKHLNRFLAPVWTDGQMGIQSIVIVTPCGKRMDDYVSFVKSKDFNGDKKISNQDECANKHIIIIPVPVQKHDFLMPNSQSKCSNHLTNIQQSGWLRNEIDGKATAYLSVEGDSAAEGTYVILDSARRNVTGQKWTFVNKQLRNANGKCLTAWTEQSWYLYQYDCRSDWAGQIWIRNGLQIFNGFGYCLTSQRWKNDYVVQHNCDSTSSFIWYDWDVECEELKRGMLP